MTACGWNGAADSTISDYALMNCERPIEIPGGPSADSDVELLKRIAQGDSAALGSFYDAHSSALFGLAYRILGDHKEAEDVLQDAFLQLWEKAVTFDPRQGRPLAWVVTLTRNKAIDRLRSAQRRARLFDNSVEDPADEPISTSPSAPEAVDAGEHAKFVAEALARLPPEQKQAIEMAFFRGLSQTEIAAFLNQPLGTIKARIRRGMLKLREQVEPWLHREAPKRPGDAGERN